MIVVLFRSARTAVSLSISSAEPGRPLPEDIGWRCRAPPRRNPDAKRDVRAARPSPRCTSSASANVSCGGIGSIVTVSNRPRSDGLICISRAMPFGDASAQTTRRPAVIAGMI